MIILLNGLSRSGKDTVARLLVEMHSMRHVKIADPLKQTVSAMFGIPMDHLEDDRKDLPCVDYPSVTPRDLMKFIGTDVGQLGLERVLPGVQRGFWIRRLIQSMEPLQHDYVVSDYRYPHEYEALRSAFSCVPIVRVRVVPQFDAFEMPKKLDHAEQILACDRIIYNKNMESLRETIRNFF